MISTKLAAGGPALVTGVVALSGALPGVAQAHTTRRSAVSKAAVIHEVAVAKAELKLVRRDARARAAAARQAMVRVSTDTHRAAVTALDLSKRTNLVAASALTSVAGLLGTEASTYTSLIGHTSGATQLALAQAIKPAITGQSFLTTLLEDLTATTSSTGGSTTTSGSTSTATSTGSTSTTATATGTDTLGSIATLLNQAAGDLSQISGLLTSGGLTTQLESVLGGALSTTSGAVDQQITQLEALIPDLPGADQASATQLLGQLQSEYTSTSSTLQSVTNTVAGQLGAPITQQLTELTNWLSGLLGGISNTLSGIGSGISPTGSSSTTGTTATTGTSTSTSPVTSLTGLGSGSGSPAGGGGLSGVLGSLFGGGSSTGGLGGLL